MNARVSSAAGVPEGLCLFEQRVAGRRRTDGDDPFRPGKDCTGALLPARAGRLAIRMRYQPFPLGDWAPSTSPPKVLTVKQRA